jgi:hypothetical protein
MPPAFPDDEFRAFGIAANAFFPELMSDENLFDPLEKRRHFDWSWQAVRYRYRTCTEYAEEFKALLASPSESWVAGLGDEELTYRLERCVYIFFMGGLSVFESLGFCLYFLGGTLQPSDFPHIATPKKITLAAASKAFTAAFPMAAITSCLAALLKKPEFAKIDTIRNLLAHRLSGRRSVRGTSAIHPDGTRTHTHEETWHIPGLRQKLKFDDDMLHRHLDEINGMLTTVIAAAREFAKSQNPATAKP